MKTFKFVFFTIMLVLISSCGKNDAPLIHDFEFVKEYSATVTVGGFVGITERVFEIGEVYNGTDNGVDVITIRIAEHSELNDNCPSSACSQELLVVPRQYLKIID